MEVVCADASMQIEISNSNTRFRFIFKQ